MSGVMEAGMEDGQGVARRKEGVVLRLLRGSPWMRWRASAAWRWARSARGVRSSWPRAGP
jgi:hypothetical protein